MSNKAVKFLKKNLSNILFIGFILFLFTPYGLPVRATLIKGLSFVTTRVFSLEIEKKDQSLLSDYDWKLQRINGETLNMESFRGKLILVNYWATWCPPCVAEMPSFQNLYNDYGDKVVFLFVANDDRQKVNQFLRKKGYNFPVYFQMSQAPEQINSNALPTTYLLDQKGHIIVNKVGAADWNSSKVRALLDRYMP